MVSVWRQLKAYFKSDNMFLILTPQPVILAELDTTEKVELGAVSRWSSEIVFLSGLQNLKIKTNKQKQTNKKTQET